MRTTDAGTWLFGPATVRVLDAYRVVRTLVVVDCDALLKVLAPGSHLPIRTIARLERVAACRRLVIVTGRYGLQMRTDLAHFRRFDLIDGREVVLRPLASPTRSRIGLWYARLSRSLGSVPGIRIERRCASLTVRYAERRIRYHALSAVRREISFLDGATIHERSGAIDVNPRQTPCWLPPLARIRDRLGDPPTILVGDGVVDSDISESLTEEILCVGVNAGARAFPRPRVFVRTLADVDQLLEELVPGGPSPRRSSSPPDSVTTTS